jgi:hypothetical protein
MPIARNLLNADKTFKASIKVKKEGKPKCRLHRSSPYGAKLHDFALVKILGDK